MNSVDAGFFLGGGRTRGGGRPSGGDEGVCTGLVSLAGGGGGERAEFILPAFGFATALSACSAGGGLRGTGTALTVTREPEAIEDDIDVGGGGGGLALVDAPA